MEGSKNSTILVVVVVVIGLVLYLLVNKATAAVKSVNQSVKQTYTAGTAAAAVATSLAPALGQFLSNLGKPGASSGPLDSQGIPIADGGGGSWDTTWQNSLPTTPSSAAFADDTSHDYLLD